MAVQKTTLQFLPKIVTFEHRHENKSCSACRERVNERMRECENVRVRDCENVIFKHKHENKSCSV